MRIRDVYPRSQIRFFPIPDPNFFHPGSASKNLSILTQKIVSKLSEIWSGLSILDSNPGSWFFTHPGSRAQGSKRQWIQDPRSATLVVTYLKNPGTCTGTHLLDEKDQWETKIWTYTVQYQCLGRKHVKVKIPVVGKCNTVDSSLYFRALIFFIKKIQVLL